MLLVITICIGCAPMNKNSYMEQYCNFINDVAENYQTYSDAKWVKVAAKYNDFSEKWYVKFENQLSVKEKVLVAGYNVKFNYYYARSQSKEVVDGIIELIDSEDVQQIVNGLKEEGSNALRQLEQLYDNL